MKSLMAFSFMYMKLKFTMSFSTIVLTREIYPSCALETKRRKLLSKKDRPKPKVVTRLKFGVRWRFGC